MSTTLTLKPFVFRYDKKLSVQGIIDELLEKAKQREAKPPHFPYVHAMLQHLVGAALELSVKNRNITVPHRSVYSDTDGTKREIEFVINTTVIYVATRPTHTLMPSCMSMYRKGYLPIIMTSRKSLEIIEALADWAGNKGKIQICRAEEYVATTLFKLSAFQTSERRLKLEELITKYNEIVDKCEGEPSLLIRIGTPKR